MAAIKGVTRSLMKAVTTAPKATPITTATARSITLPRSRKARNSFSIFPSFFSGIPAKSQILWGRSLPGNPVGERGHRHLQAGRARVQHQQLFQDVRTGAVHGAHVEIEDRRVPFPEGHRMVADAAFEEV